MKLQLPEYLDLDCPANYSLTVRIHAEQFSFSLHNPANGEIHCFQELPVNKQGDAFSTFKDIFFENDFFTLPYRKIVVLNCSPTFTFIPSILYEEKDRETWINFNFLENTGHSLAQSLQHPMMTILHEIPKDIYTFFQRSFVNPQFIHHFSVLISYFQQENRLNHAQNCLIVSLQVKGIDVLCFSHGNFILGNHFKSNDMQKVMYYVLFTWKQLKFDQEKDCIYIAGTVERQKILTEEIKKYIQQVVPVDIIKSNHSSHSPGISSAEVPIELLMLPLCEL